MGYQIIEPYSNVTIPNGLGVGFNSNNSIYLTVDQAFQNLKNLLLTKKGERVIMPNFGTDLLSVIFESNLSAIKEVIADILTPPINYWLPYINIISIDTITAEDDPSLNYNISITISFSVSTYNTQSITISATESGILEVSNG